LGGLLTPSRKNQVALIAALPFTNASNLLDVCVKNSMSISDVVWANELKWRTESQVSEQTLKIWHTMDASIRNGCLSEQQILPGVLKVKRRAPMLFQKLVRESGYCPQDLLNNHIVSQAKGASANNESDELVLKNNQSINEIAAASGGMLLSKNAATQVKQSSRRLFALDWLSLFAIAVNEENAAGGRVVTAPTNGAAGIIPAVLKYFLEFVADFDQSNSKMQFMKDSFMKRMF
jgi:L-serine deaminase